MNHPHLPAGPRTGACSAIIFTLLVAICAILGLLAAFKALLPGPQPAPVPKALPAHRMEAV